MQNFLCDLQGMRILNSRYGPRFRRALEFLSESQWWPYEKLREYQNARLRIVVDHAYRNVPYYTRLFDELGLHPRDIRNSTDLQKLPVLTKEQVVEAGEDLISTAFSRKRLCQGFTSGTTGSSLKVVSLPESVAMQWAVWWRHRRRFGLRLGDPHVQFTAKHIVPFKQQRPPFWRMCRPLNQLRISLAHLKPDHIEKIIGFLEQGGWYYYAGYPSAVYLLADYLCLQNRTIKNGPEFFVSGSESLLPFQRSHISKWLNCRVIDQYGMAEGVANISQCEAANYHIDMEFAIVEDHHVVSKENGSYSCKIIGTALHNSAMPLLRYDTGDIMTISGRQCTCGRKSPVVDSIDGRIESYIVTPSGRRLGRLMTVFKDMTAIREAQICQDQVDTITVKIAKYPKYRKKDEIQLLENFRMRVGDELKINFQYVDRIARQSGKKFRAVISTVDDNLRKV